MVWSYICTDGRRVLNNQPVNVSQYNTVSLKNENEIHIFVFVLIQARDYFT